MKYNYEHLYKNKGYKYCYEVVYDELFVIRNGEKIHYTAPKYVKLQCEKFMEDLEKSQNDDYPYFFDIKMLKKIEKLLQIIQFGDGFNVGKSCYEGLAEFQWFVIINIFCWKHKENRKKRRYELIVMLITRKQAKTFLSAIIFILLMLLEPKFSEFYSVSSTKDLASQIKKEIRKTIKSSEAISKYFKDIRSETKCLLTDSLYLPLACDNSGQTLDGRKPTCWLADEVGSLKNDYPISAMQSGQMGMLNRLGVLISTAYTESNPLEDYVEYCQRVLDGLVEDDTVFSLLYRPNDCKDWLNDQAIYQVSPLSVELNNQGITDNLDYVFKKRSQALEIPSTEGNFKTKLLNIKVSSLDTVPYISLDDLRLCKIEKYNWRNKEVWLSFDLSISGDNTAVSILTFDEKLQKFISQSWCFIPSGKVEEKMKKEKVDYITAIEKGECYAIGDKVIDYAFIEDFILNYLQNQLKVKIKNISYDRYNATSTVGKLENEGLILIDIPQNYKTLNTPTKKLKDLVLTQQFAYVENTLFELNVSNAQLMSSGTLEMISKKSSNFKIDMIASLINAFAVCDIELEKPSVYETNGIEYIQDPIKSYDNRWNF